MYNIKLYMFLYYAQGTVLNDFLVTTFCTPCALTQEAQVCK